MYVAGVDIGVISAISENQDTTAPLAITVIPPSTEVKSKVVVAVEAHNVIPTCVATGNEFTVTVGFPELPEPTFILASVTDTNV